MFITGLITYIASFSITVNNTKVGNRRNTERVVKALKQRKTFAEAKSFLAECQALLAEQGRPPVDISITEVVPNSNFSDDEVEEELKREVQHKPDVAPTGREVVRQLEGDGSKKRNVTLRLEKKQDKKKRGKAKKEQNRRAKQMSKRDRNQPSPLHEISFEGGMRMIEMKKRQEQRKVEKQRPQFVEKKEPMVPKSTGIVAQVAPQMSKPKVVHKMTKKQKEIGRQRRAAYRERDNARSRRRARREAERNSQEEKKQIMSETGDYFDDLFDHLDLSVIGRPYVRGTISFLWQLYRSRSAIDVVAAVNQYCTITGVKLDSVLNSILDDIKDYMSHLPFLSESGEIVKTVLEFMDRVISSELVQLAKKFLLSIAGVKWLGPGFTSKVANWIGKSQKMTVLQFVYDLLDSIHILIEIGSEYLTGDRTLMEVILSPDPVGRAVEKTLSLVNRSEMITLGLPRPGYMMINDYVNELIGLVDFLIKSKKKLSPFSPISKRVEQAITAGSEALDAKLNYVKSHNRPVPYGVVLYGPSGIGKGPLLKYFVRIMGDVRQREFSDGQLYRRSAISEYWEGYQPFSQPYIHYPEVARIKRTRAAASGDPAIDEILELIDCNAFSCNTAFADKGKVFAYPELVIMDTNNPDLNADVLYHCSAAYKRRFVYIRPVVREEFRIDGSSSLDPIKAQSHEGHPLDLYHFYIEKFSMTTEERKTVFHGSLSEVTEFLHRDMSTHVALNAYLRDNVYGVDTCYPASGDESVVHDDEEYKSGMESEQDSVSYDDADYSQASDSEGSDDSGLLSYDEKIQAYEDASSSDYSDDEEQRYMKSRGPQVAKAGQKWRIVSQSGIYIPPYILEHPAVTYVQTAISEQLMEWFFMFVRALATWLACLVVVSYMQGSFSDQVILLSASRFLMSLVICYVCGISFFTFGGLLLSCCMQVNETLIIRDVYSDYLKKTAVNVMRQKAIQAKTLVHLVTGRTMNIVRNETWVTRSLGVAVAVIGTMAFFGYGKKKLSSFFGRKPSLHVESGPDIYESGHARIRIPVAGKPSVWNAMDVRSNKFEDPKHRGSAQVLAEASMRNARRIAYPVGDSVKTTHILGIKGRAAIINEHAFKGQDEIHFKVVDGDGVQNRKVQVLKRSDCVDVTTDVVMFNIDGTQFRDLTVHMNDDDRERTMAGYFNTGKVRLSLKKGDYQISDDVSGEYSVESILAYSAPHKPGMCGLPLVAEYGNGAVICGIHAAGRLGSDDAYGLPIHRALITEALDQLDCNSLFVVQSESGAFEQCYELPGRKSLVRFEELGELTYLGKVPGPIILDSKSRLRKSRLVDVVEAFFHDECKVTDHEEYVPPPMRPFTRDGEYYSPYNIAVRKMAKPRASLKASSLAKVVCELSQRLIKGLEERGVEKLSPLTRAEAINGVDDDPYIRRINATTAAGFGFKGKKSDYIVLQEDGVTRLPTQSLVCRLDSILLKYGEGRTHHPIYKACLKDEPRLREKADVGKTRVFYASPLDALVVSRRFLAPLYSLMCRFGDLFCTAVGIDMHTEAHQLYSRLSEFSHDIIEGDYGGYDLQMPHGVGEAVNEVICRVLKHFGYNDAAMQVVKGILTDNLFPYVCILNDVFCVPGLQPSGKYATAEDNSLRGLVLLMYFWYEGLGEERDFFDYLLPVTYGDDVLVSSRLPEFNALAYARFVEANYGMTFTTAAKGEVEEPFILPRDMSFLKRSFVYQDRFGAVVAPLPVETFIKALGWVLPSRSQTEAEQMMSTVVSMCREFAFYRPDLHEKFVYTMVLALELHYDIPTGESASLIPKLDELIYSLGYSEHAGSDAVQGISEDSRKSTDSLVPSFFKDLAHRPPRSESGWDRTLIIRFADEKEEDINDMTMQELGQAIESSPYFSEVFGSQEPLRFAMRKSHIPREYKRMIERYFDIKASQRSMYDVRTESGTLNSGQVQNEIVEGNYDDVVGDDLDTNVSGVSFFPKMSQDTQLPLEDFFLRPVQVANFPIVTGGSVLNNIPIWDLWSLDPTVRAKLRNYAYFRGDLHVRVSVSGSPFHYGRLIVSYQPYAINNTALSVTEGSLLSFPDMRPLLMNYLSQSRGATTIDVKANRPAEIVCPYISHKPMFRLFNSDITAISDVTSFDDFENAGKLIIATLNDVGSVSASPSDVRVQVIVWATNVQLGTTTGTQVGITTQSGDADEWEQGPIEKIATNAAQVSHLLSSWTPFAPFAKASQMVFGGLGEVAALFGWSKPSIVDEPMVVKNEPYQNGSQVIGYDTGKRLTIDPKQEITVDPRVAGVEDDDLNISRIGAITTYLTTFEWTASDAPLTPIWYARVEPMLHTLVDVGGIAYMQPTAMAFAATPFSYWNARIVFRFEVVASAYHRGKFAVFYEPNVAQHVLIAANVELNRQFIAVIDIQETQTFEVCVEWAYPRYWAVVAEPQAAGQNYGASINSSQANTCNGFIGVMPITTVQSPDDSNLPLNVYVRAEELSVNYQGFRGLPEDRRIRTESGEYGVSSDEKMTCIPLNGRDIDLSQASTFHFGETPLSFRSLLKRFMRTSTFTRVAGSATNSCFRIDDRVFPENALPFGSTSVDPVMSLFSYLSYAYVGARGGIRKRLHLNGDIGQSSLAQVKVSNATLTTTATTGLFLVAEPARSYQTGTVSFVPSTNGGIEVEIPFYSNNLFFFSFTDDMVGTSNTDEMVAFWNKLVRFELDVTNSFSDLTVDIESAASEDFCFLRYQGAPYFVVT